MSALPWLTPLRQVWQTRTWLQVPCRIVAAEVVPVPSRKGGRNYTIDVSFVYHPAAVMGGGQAGPEHTGRRYALRWESDSNRIAKEMVVQRLRGRPQTVCWVDPHDPTQSVLDRSLGAALPPLWLLVFLIFPIVGLLAIPHSFHERRRLGGWWRRDPPFSRPPVRSSSVFLMGLVSLVMGVGSAFGFYVLPLWRCWQAQGWVAVPCHLAGAHGPQDIPRFIYRWGAEGEGTQTLTGYRFNLSADGQADPAQLSAGYPSLSGTASATCHVDPHDPFNAVLDRSVGRALPPPTALLMLVFIPVGLFIILMAFVHRRKQGGH